MVIFTLSTKKCMADLLLHHTFDAFSFIEGEIITFNKFSLNGRIQKDFFEETPDKEFSDWKDVRELCFSIIKGKRTPLGFKLVLSLSPSDIPAFLLEKQLSYEASDIQGLYLNLRYDGLALSCITGTSLRSFTLDKSLEPAWDKWVQQFFAAQSIPFELE